MRISKWSGYFISLIIGALICTGCLVGNTSANADTVEAVTVRLVEALHSGHLDDAQQQYSSAISTKISTLDLKIGLRELADDLPIKKYTSLQICEWEIVVQNRSSFITGLGIIKHDNGQTRFISTIRFDEDEVWRIFGLKLQPLEDSHLWGACR